MKNKVLKIFGIIGLIVFEILLSVFIAFGCVISFVYAATSEEVLQDLRKDKDFDESDYPYVKDDYSLKVIQIAESANKELFVYAYQPCHDMYDLVGTKISISYGYSVDGSGLTPELKNLRLISTSGTFDKYLVDGFTVPNDGDRYYNIVEIFRMVNTDIDEVDEAFPKTDIAYPVGQQWYVCDLNGSKHYEMNTFKTLPVETVFNSSVRVSNGFTFPTLGACPEYCDLWFYCFNQEEYVITHIFDADLNYSMDHIVVNAFGVEDRNIVCNNEVISLTDDQEISYKGNGLGAREFVWKRIMKSSEFVTTIEKQVGPFSDSEKDTILSSQWVFTYLETQFQESIAMPTANYYDVYDVGLLRLHFQDVSGAYYDLGVVNDLTNPDENPSVISDMSFEEFWEAFVRIILIIVGVIMLVLLLNFVTPIMGVLKFIFKAIAFVISIPFKLLKSILKKDG